MRLRKCFHCNLSKKIILIAKWNALVKATVPIDLFLWIHLYFFLISTCYAQIQHLKHYSQIQQKYHHVLKDADKWCYFLYDILLSYFRHYVHGLHLSHTHSLILSLFFYYMYKTMNNRILYKVTDLETPSLMQEANETNDEDTKSKQLQWFNRKCWNNLSR